MSDPRRSFKRKDVTITVTAGSGSSTLPIDGKINDLFIKAPTSTANYDFEILDSDSFGVHGRSNNKGNQSLDVEKITQGTQTIEITGSNMDGVFTVRIKWETGRFRDGTRDF